MTSPLSRAEDFHFAAHNSVPARQGARRSAPASIRPGRAQGRELRSWLGLECLREQALVGPVPSVLDTLRSHWTFEGVAWPETLRAEWARLRFPVAESEPLRPSTRHTQHLGSLPRTVGQVLLARQLEKQGLEGLLSWRGFSTVDWGSSLPWPSVGLTAAAPREALHRSP